MACDKETILFHIQRQISSGSPCEADIEELLEVFWELAGYEACYNTMLQGLITKLEAITYLMGCEAYSVDTKESHYTMTALTVADSVSDTITQSQATGSSSKYARGQANTKYDESSRALSDGHNTRTARGTEVGDGSSFYRDDGSGYARNDSQSFNAITNTSFTRDERLSSTDGVDRSNSNECNYEYSTNNTFGQGVNVAIIASSFTGTGSEWRKYNRANATGFENVEYLATNFGQQRDIGLTRGQGTHDWVSFFYSDIEWNEADHEVTTRRDRSDNRRTAEAHALGSGDGISETKAESKATTQGTAKSTTDSKSTREATRTSNKVAFELANSQRFRNLRLLYDQITQQIDHLKKRIRQTATPFIDQLPCKCVGDCCCMPRIPAHCSYLMQLGELYADTNCFQGCSPGTGRLW